MIVEQLQLFYEKHVSDEWIYNSHFLIKCMFYFYYLKRSTIFNVISIININYLNT